MRYVGRYVHLFLFSVLLLGVLSSCSDDLSVSPEKASMDREPELESSASSFELDQTNFDQTAVEFSWSPGSNHGTNAAIDYALEIAGSGEFESPVRVEMGRDVYSKSYTVEAFNSLLLDRLNMTPETAGEVHVRVESATADTSVSPDHSNVVMLTPTPYEPVTSTLYLVGSAAPNGWDADNATPLEQDENRPYVFTYQGDLSAGELKFITTQGQFLPSYNRGEGDGQLFHRTEESQPDDKFLIEESGPYRITANLAELTISIERQEGPPHSELWVVGSATPNGWSLDNADKMRQDPGNPFLFDYNEVLSEGEFKIATEKSFTAPFYRPTENHPPISNTEVQLSAGDPDHKWYISEPGAYKITLDVRDMSISIEPFTPYDQLWIVGSATPNGWNIDNPNEMQQDPDNEYVFTYSGELSAGEFKFPVSTGDWGTDYFMPPANHAPLDSSYVRFIPGGQPDNKWEITQGGTYEITLNQLYETIQVEQQ